MRRFAVIGLGRFGQKLAIALAMSGAEVIAIDKDRNEIEMIRDQVSHAVRLDGTDEEALQKAVTAESRQGFQDIFEHLQVIDQEHHDYVNMSWTRLP